ncbi:unnamed protein product [Camellia sinensis]
MNIAIRSKSLFRFSTTSFPSISLQNPKWVSTATPKSPPQHPENHLRPFFNGQKTQKPRDYELAIVSTLKSCSTLLAISQGQQVHALVLKSGLNSNMFIQNSLINMYAKFGFLTDAQYMFDSCPVLDSVSCNIMIVGYVKFGRLDDARKLFDVMPCKGCVSYTSMIIGLAQNDCWSEAIGVFRDLMFEVVMPNEVTMSSVISAYSHLGGIWDCRMLHGLVKKLGLEVFVLVSTNLVHMYCVCSSLWDARALFDEMAEPNVVSWNVMMNGYSKAGFVDLARDLFDRISTRDVVCWGTIIDGYVRAGRLDEAFTLYRAMLRTGLGPNDVMIVDLISACGKLMAFGEGQQFHGITIKTGFDCYDFMQATIIHFYAACHRVEFAWLQFELSSKDHVPSWNALIAGLVRNRMIDLARQLFNDMPERDVVSWSSMISGYSQSKQPNLALELFHEMVACNVKPNEITMVCVLSAIATLGILKEGRWAHEYIRNNSIPLNDNLNAAIIDMYAKCGSIKTALEVFHQIRDKSFSVSPWNAIIGGLAMHGHAELSLKIFSDLQNRNIKLNAITFTGVLCACCHAGLVEAGKQHFQSMKRLHDVEPTIKHYGCMVDLLGRAGRLEEAEELIRSMPMKADVVIWGTLLAACRTHGNAEIGVRAAESLARVEPSHGGGRVLLSNIYADAGRWEDAFLVRQAMKSQRMTRSLGYSGVTAEEAMMPTESTFSLDVNSKLDCSCEESSYGMTGNRDPCQCCFHSKDSTVVLADMPLYDILNEFQKGGSHLAAVVRAKGKNKISPSTVIKEKAEENKVATRDSQLTTPLLSKQDQKPASVVVDIEKAPKPPIGNRHTTFHHNDASTNGLPHMSEDIEDGEQIRVAAAAAASSMARIPSIRRLTGHKGPGGQSKHGLTTPKKSAEER